MLGQENQWRLRIFYWNWTRKWAASIMVWFPNHWPIICWSTVRRCFWASTLRIRLRDEVWSEFFSFEGDYHLEIVFLGDYPSISAIVGNLDMTPFQFGATIQIQTEARETFVYLQDPVRDRLMEFYQRTKQKPRNIIVYRYFRIFTIGSSRSA